MLIVTVIAAQIAVTLTLVGMCSRQLTAEPDEGGLGRVLARS
jgi:hypothetical protein